MGQRAETAFLDSLKLVRCCNSLAVEFSPLGFNVDEFLPFGA